MEPAVSFSKPYRVIPNNGYNTAQKNELKQRINELIQKKNQHLEQKKILETALEFVERRDKDEKTLAEKTNLESSLSMVVAQLFEIDDQIDNLGKLYDNIDKFFENIGISDNIYNNHVNAPVVQTRFKTSIQYTVTYIKNINLETTLMNNVFNRNQSLWWYNANSESSYTEIIKSYYPIFEMFDDMVGNHFCAMMIFYDMATNNIVVMYNASTNANDNHQNLNTNSWTQKLNLYFQKYIDFCKTQKMVQRLEIYQQTYISSINKPLVTACLYSDKYSRINDYIEFVLNDQERMVKYVHQV